MTTAALMDRTRSFARRILLLFPRFFTAKFSLAICNAKWKVSSLLSSENFLGKSSPTMFSCFIFYYFFLLCHVWVDLIIGDQTFESCKRNNDVNVIVIDHKVHSKEVIKCNKKYYQRRANRSIQNVRLSAEGRRSHEQSIDTMDWHAIFLH